MSDVQFYITVVAVVLVGIAIAALILDFKERKHCHREAGQYKCKGESCEGCYRIIGGKVVYEYPQPANGYGEAPLSPWGKRPFELPKYNAIYRDDK